jgi:alpha-D-ribose 1-methylphosphonate 5-triphosphate synthase subunit PhnI
VRLLDGSGVNREVHAPFCERPGVQLLRPTCHWLHWVLDVSFGEDASTVRKNNAHNISPPPEEDRDHQAMPRSLSDLRV